MFILFMLNVISLTKAEIGKMIRKKKKENVKFVLIFDFYQMERMNLRVSKKKIWCGG